MDRLPDVRPGGILCPLDALADPGARAFKVVFDDGHAVGIFVVRRGAGAFAYVNVCPHQFLPLNWSGDMFLGFAKRHIVCIHHGAAFDIETGAALGGPVPPDCGLRPVPVTVEGGAIRLAAEGIPRF